MFSAPRPRYRDRVANIRQAVIAALIMVAIFSYWSVASLVSVLGGVFRHKKTAGEGGCAGWRDSSVGGDNALKLAPVDLPGEFRGGSSLRTNGAHDVGV